MTLQNLHRSAIPKFLFGDDVFISYSRADGATYAAGLGNQMTSRTFSTRLDQWGSEPGENMPESLKNALRRCAALVLVGTPGAAASKHVDEEVRVAKEAGLLILPILFEAVWVRNAYTPRDGRLVQDAPFEEHDARREAVWAASIAGLSISIEHSSALSSGEPSPEVINRIEKACTFRKRNARLRAVSYGLGAVLASLIVAITVAGRMASSSAKEAASQQRMASARRASSSAQDQRAQALRTTNWAERLQGSALLSVEAARRMSAEGLPGLEADRALRDVLDLLPRSVRKVDAGQEVTFTFVPRGAGYVAAIEEDKALRVYEPRSGTRLGEIKIVGQWAIDRGATKLAMLDAGELKLFALPGGSVVRRIAGPKTSRFHFSPDGMYLAADVPTPTPRIVVWEVANANKVAEVVYREPLVEFAVNGNNTKLALSLAGANDDQSIVEIWSIDTAPRRLVRSRIALREPSIDTAHAWLQDVVFSPDGKYLAGTTGYHVLLLNATDGNLFRRLDALEQDHNPRNDVTIDRFDFSPDGRLVAVVADGSQQTWTIQGNQVWSTDRRLTGYVFDGGRGGIQLSIVSIAEGQGSLIMDVRTGKELTRAFVGEDVRVCGADERAAFVTLCKDKSIWLYETRSTEAAERDFDDISGDGTLGATPTGHVIEIWDRDHGRRRRSIPVGGVPVSRTSFTPDGKGVAAVIAAAAPEDVKEAQLPLRGNLVVWDSSTGQEVWRRSGVLAVVQPDGYDEPRSATDVIRFSPKGQFVTVESLTSEGESIVHIFEVGTQREVVEKRNSSADGNSLYFTLDDKVAAFRDRDTIQIVELATGNVSDLPLEEVSAAVEFSRETGLLARKTKDGVEVRKPGEEPLYILPADPKSVTVGFSPSGKYLAIATAGSGQVVEAASGRRLADLPIGSPVKSLDFSDREDYLFAFGDKKHVGTWRLPDGKKVGGAMTAEGSWALVFSPDERYVAVNGKALQVWSLVTGEMEAELDRVGNYRELTFSDDGRYLAGNPKEQQLVRVWDSAGWADAAVIQVDEFLSELQFVPGKHLLETTVAGEVSTWLLSRDEMIARVCRSLPRNLTTSEWRIAFGNELHRKTCPGLPE